MVVGNTDLIVTRKGAANHLPGLNRLRGDRTRADWLHRCGYKPRSILKRLQSLAGWTDWLAETRKSVTDLSEGLEQCKMHVESLPRATALDNALDKLKDQSGKPVSLLIGPDVAAFLLRFGAKLLA